MSHFYKNVMHYMDHMSPQEWAWVMIAAIFIGAMCLRGFGSRSQY